MLNSISVNKVKNAEDFLGRAVQESHYTKIIEESSIINLEGNKPVAYLNLDDPSYDDFLSRLQNLKFNKSNRGRTGKGNYSISTGALTARMNRSNSCNIGALLAKDDYLHYSIIDDLSHDLNLVFQALLPQWHKVSGKFYDQANINPDYRMFASFWTSAIINFNSAQNYHYDDANLINVYSSMLVFKKEVSGGYLVMPEYDLAFRVSNRSLIFFYGKNILHGVSPIAYHSENAYRYSIVLYALGELSKCESLKIERKKS